MPLHALTVLISSMLLFLVQPLIGRYILPWYGGSSSVWTTSQLFFQLLLLVGYLYSHLVAARLRRAWQMRVHGILVLGSLALLAVGLVAWETPITPPKRWALGGGGSPVLQILGTLTASVGLPYLVLSTTSPLIQAWYVQAFPRRSPYPLYALSNAGSIAALLSYPLVLQRRLTVSAQAWLWTSSYGVFVLALVGAAAYTARIGESAETANPVGSPALGVDDARSKGRGSPTTPGHPVLWVLLPATASVVLLGATNQMTQDVAAVPILWVVPLALYLLTFVIAFARADSQSWRAPQVRWYLVLLGIAMPAFRGTQLWGNSLAIQLQLVIYGVVAFAACQTCHSELARLRPRGSRLTGFYLAMAAGGAVGGALVTLVAPLVFDAFWELPLGVLACWILAGVCKLLERPGLAQKRLRQSSWGLILVGLAVVFAGSTAWSSIRIVYEDTLDAARNFYGAHRVQLTTLGRGPGSEAYRLVHGTTIHGVQYAGGGELASSRRRTPTSYFAPTSGVGLAMTGLRNVLTPTTPDGPPGPVGAPGRSLRSARSVRIGVLGLGTGTLAAYGRRGDVMRFYEIDPQVIAYARGEGGYFSYLADSEAEVEIVQGDARLSLERELDERGGQAYDLIAVDVFSGDSPPVHLLTREAFDLYLAHLAGGGILALNISTTHLDLAPVIAALARDAELAGSVVEDPGDGEAAFASRWVLVGEDATALAALSYPDLQTWHDPAVRVWTDDYSDLVGAIRNPLGVARTP